MTGEISYDLRPCWQKREPDDQYAFTVYSEHLEQLARRRWLMCLNESWSTSESDDYIETIGPSGFFPVNPEEDSSSDSNLPQGQNFDIILSDESPPRQLVRTKARSAPPHQATLQRAGKRPRSDMFAWNDHHAVSADSEDEGDEVDLKRYFKKHRVSAKQQVRK